MTTAQQEITRLLGGGFKIVIDGAARWLDQHLTSRVGRLFHVVGTRCLSLISAAVAMAKLKHSGDRFPPEIVQPAIWPHLRFTQSFCDIKDLLAERGIIVPNETLRRWLNHF